MAVIRTPNPGVSQTTTYEAFGNAEDYSSVITNIDPDQTPFLSNLAEDTDAKELKYNWMIENLRPPKKNAHLEMEDYTFNKVGSLGSLSNNVQHFINSGKVSDAMRKTMKLYEQQDEFTRQQGIAFTGHAHDIEYALVNNDKVVEGTGTVAAETGGIPYFLGSSALDATVDTATGLITTSEDHKLSTGNFVFFSAETLPTDLKADVPYYINVKTSTTFNIYSTMKGAVEELETDQVKPTDAGTSLKVERNNVVDLGGKREWTLDDIDNMMYKATLRGGAPTDLWMSYVNKKRFSKLLIAQTTNIRRGAEKKLNLTADTYEGDFGVVTARTHMMYPNNRIDCIDPQYMMLKWFDRTHDVTGLPKTGTYSVFAIEGWVGLKVVAPLGNGSIINCKV